MKVLLIAFHPENMSPFAQNYIKAMDEVQIDYEVIYWDRFSDREVTKIDNVYVIHRICTMGGTKWKKIFPFYYFRKTVKEIIERGNYDKIIVINTMPGFLLSDILLKYFKNRYIFDIRDYTYEKYSFYKNIILKLIDYSRFTAISSIGFKRFLGESHKFVVNHNMNSDLIGETFSQKNIGDRINIGFVGAIRYFDENVRLINKLKNNIRFRLSYIGRNNSDCNLEQYCAEHDISNVYFQGEFSNNEKEQIYSNIDFINAIYGNTSLEVTTLLPNRLYDALIFRRPIIASKGTYLGEIVDKFRIGLTVDLEDDVSTLIDCYLHSDNFSSFAVNADNLLSIVQREQEHYIEQIHEFLR